MRQNDQETIWEKIASGLNALNDFKYKGSGIILLVFLLWLGIDYILDRRSECYILRNNYEASFYPSKIEIIDLNRRSIIISHYYGKEMRKKRFFNLSQDLIGIIEIGDTISKMGLTNQVTIRNKNVTVTFAALPDQDCKLKKLMNN